MVASVERARFNILLYIDGVRKYVALNPLDRGLSMSLYDFEQGIMPR